LLKSDKNNGYKCWNFCGDRIQWNFLGQRTASRCEGCPTFRNTTPSPSSECVGGLVATKLLTGFPTLYIWSHQIWYYQTTRTPWRWGQSYFPKCRKTFTSWRGWLPEKI